MALVAAEQLEVAFAVLATVEAHAVAGIHFVMLVAAWLDAIEVEILVGAADSTDSTELELKLESLVPSPLFLNFSH